ncbi:MAG: hypothetical protein ACYC9Z_14525 [Casimicrobiaceae bacterium]
MEDEDRCYGAAVPGAGAGTTTPDDDVLAAAGLGAAPGRASIAPTINAVAAITQAPAARVPIPMRALRLRIQKRLPHRWQR